MRDGNDKGIVLVMVMWVLTVLMVVILSFSTMAKTETTATLSYRDGVQIKFMAEAGIERGIMELLYRKSRGATTGAESLPEEEQVLKVDGTYYSFPAKGGLLKIRLISEAGKVDINAAPEMMLKNLIANLGVKDKELDIIVDSIMDWKDADNFHRLNGAEDDYYQSLPNPYKAKNANFDTLGELLLVRGVTPDLLYGSGGKKGLIDFITVYSGSATVNINAAPREVIMAVPGMDDGIADAILSYRQAHEIKSIEEVRTMVGDQYAFMSPYMSTGEGATYTVEAEGGKGEKGLAYAVKAVVQLDGDKYRFLYYKNPERLRQWHVQ
jgi:general secretion pathway protein K